MRKLEESVEPRKPVPRTHAVVRRLPLIVLVLSFLGQWALLMNINGPTWDAAFYYSYARSLVFDQDLAIANDLQRSYATASPDYVARQLHANVTSTGSVYAPFAIGSGLLWVPLVTTLRLISVVAGVADVGGFEWYFLGIVATFSALTGLLAFYVAYRITAHEASRPAALLAALTMTFATPLIYYQFREPLYAHVPSALLNTLFVAAWYATHRRIPTPWQGVLLGVLLALAALMRWQNAVYGVLPFTSILWVWLSAPPGQRQASGRQALSSLLIMGLAFLAVFSPQFMVWQAHYGSWLTIPQGNDFMDWRSPFLREIIFSPFRGLLPWMPVFIVACIGLLAQLRKRPRLILPLVLLLLISVLINASSRDWFAGGGYGPRRFAGELVIFVLGLALFLDLIAPRWRWIVGGGVGILLALHQWLLFRYALAERIGGRVVSMAPQFEWYEETWPIFMRQLAAHVPDVVRTPLEVFVLPGSPLNLALQHRQFPGAHILSLLGAALFLGAVIWLVQLLRGAFRNT